MNPGLTGWTLAAALLLCALGVTDAYAQDPVQLHPDMFKVLLEDEQVRVIDDLVPAGAKVQMHSHGEYVVYPLTSYTMKFTLPDGTTRVVEVKAGVPRHIKGAIHAEENIGTTDAHALLVEMKGSAR